MGAYEKNSFFYNDKEVFLLRSYYGKISLEELQLKLFRVSYHRRSFASIRRKAFCLGLTKKVNQDKWSNLEIDYLKKNFRILKVKDIAKNLNRSFYSVSRAISRYLPDSVVKKSFFWFDEHTKILINNLDKSNSDLAFLIGCSVGTIVRYKRSLNLQRQQTFFTKKEDDLLIYHKTKSIKELSILLNRSEGSIRTRKQFLGIHKKSRKKYQSWSDVEILFLKENYSLFSGAELSKKLNKSVNSIFYKCKSLGLVKLPQKLWTKEEDNYLLSNYSKKSLFDIGEYLGRSKNSVYERSLRLGLNKSRKLRVNRIKN